jgi:hypothetical protein
MSPEQELFTLLNSNPLLQVLQQRINNELKGKSPVERMVILSKMIVDNLDQLKTELILLQVKLDSVK